jgi:CBS domain-containing protein
MIENEPMLVTHLMQSEVVAITLNLSIEEASQLLDDLEIRHLPVVHGRKLVGMVSTRDVREYFASHLHPEAGRASVESIMNREVVFVDTRETVRAAIGLLLEYRIGAVPVVDYESGDVCGILSYVDILRVAADLL